MLIICVFAFISALILYVKSSNFSEPVLQRLVNVYCKPYLLCDVIGWSKSELSRISYVFNSAMCRIYEVKLPSSESIYMYTNQPDISQDIILRRRKFVLNSQCCDNRVIKTSLVLV